MKRRELSGRYLSLDERLQIADLRIGGASIRSIAAELGRSPSTISREIRRNGATEAGRYGPYAAHERAEQRGRRPRRQKLDNGELAGIVQDKLCLNWSPEQISLYLDREFPDRPEMQIAHETIYQALYRGHETLKPGLHRHLRRGRSIRRHRGPTSIRGSRIAQMTPIADRPVEVEDRSVAGHWEGDLILGTNCRSAIATLVERQSRYLIMVHLPNGHKADALQSPLISAISTLPPHMRKTLTWDQGTELARHREITTATNIDIYFCDPHSPWQRGTNENTNGLIRQYFPKGTDLSVHSAERLDEVAEELNTRPRKTLDMSTPSAVMHRLLSNTKPSTVATTT